MPDETFNIYFSHRRNDIKSILRGQDYSHDYSKTGESIGAYLFDWEKMDGFPRCNLILPECYDLFYITATKLGYISETNIYNTWLEIISACDLFISFGNHADEHMRNELKHARCIGIPVYNMPNITKHCIESLKFTIQLLLKAK